MSPYERMTKHKYDVSEGGTFGNMFGVDFDAVASRHGNSNRSCAKQKVCNKLLMTSQKG